MDLTSVQSCGSVAVLERKDEDKEAAAVVYASMVDPFLVEALQNPRHRLTILRMELDLQKFLRSPDTFQFEFPHFPTSYLRLAAHRVAQHYGLQTVAQDKVIDGQGIRILVTKKPESKFPAIYLSDVPAIESENDKVDQTKIVLKLRPKSSSSDAKELGLKSSPVRSVEEREEEYERARARIFSTPGSSESEEASARVVSDGRKLNVDENKILRNFAVDGDKSLRNREIGSISRVAILRDLEKDRTDPDYNRSYGRYVKRIPNTQSFNVTPFNIQKLQPPFVHYDSAFHQMSQMPAPQASLNYMTSVVGPYYTMGSNQVSGGGLYMQWPIQSAMYAQSYDQLRLASCQGPFYQQPLSSENYR